MVRNSPETAAVLAAPQEGGQGEVEAWRTSESEQEEEDADTIRGENRLIRAAVTELAAGVPYMRDEDQLEIRNPSCHAFSA
jgi:hypothetical protein